MRLTIEQADKQVHRAWMRYSAAEKGGHVQDMDRLYTAYLAAWERWSKLVQAQPVYHDASHLEESEPEWDIPF